MRTRAPILLLALASASFASDHREAPLVSQDLPADLADVYAFPNPNDASKLVLVLTVNGFTAPTENTTFNFSPEVLYSFRIDNDGDGGDDVCIDFSFSRDLEAQTFLGVLPGLGTVTGDVTLPTLAPTPNPEIVTSGPGGVRVFAGQRDDPFFFDVVGFDRVLGGGSFTNMDGFAGFNCSALVLEVPLSYATGGNPGPIGIWAETSRRFVQARLNEEGAIVPTAGGFRQVDRVGNPAVNTALIPSARKDFYNVSDPALDAATFASDVVASLTSLGTSQANIDVLASVAVPDTLKFDPASPVGFPNGRTLSDDVIDTLFSFIFNQTGVTDGVAANDAAFQGTFPFVAPPFQPQ